MNAHQIVALQVAEQIDIKNFRKAFIGIPYFADTSEVMYQKGDQHEYFYALSYGVVVFLGYNEIKMSEIIDFLRPYCKNLLEERMREDFEVIETTDKDVFDYNRIVVSRFEQGVLRIIMMNVGQSVALDYFAKQTDRLLEDMQRYTQQLEHRGRLNISGRQLRRYIGKSLNLKNRIVENLYILDSPEEAWEDEYLSKIDAGMKRTFDLSLRHRSLTDDLSIVKENLDLFKDLMMHSNSAMLEWIVIILILFEVITMIFEKI